MPVVERTFEASDVQLGTPHNDDPLVFSGHCDGSPDAGSLCVRKPNGRWEETTLPLEQRRLLGGHFSACYVAASRDGEPYAVDGGTARATP